MDKKIVDALNEQLNKEYFSSYLYLSMAAYFSSIDLPGCESWMKCQSQEELGHALKIYGYLTSRGEKVELKAIEAPQTGWSSVSDVFEETLEHEKMITDSVHGLVKIAKDLNDYGTEFFLQWYVTEQIEEEASVNDILVQLKRIKEDGPSMIMLDRGLAARARSK